MHWISELRYQDAATKVYLGSPSLTRLPNGNLLATHDYFGPDAPRNHEGAEFLTSVYRSHDNGASWTSLTHIVGAYWSVLFVHHGALYLLGTSAEYGSIVIRRSDDLGSTWTHPVDETSGLLFRGGPGRQAPNYHCAPMPIVEWRDRLYRAFEDNDPLHWPSGFQSCVISCGANADLLQAANWRMSNKLRYDPALDPPDWGGASGAGWLEGNVVVAPDGEIWNILRVHSTPAVDRAAIVRVHDEGRTLTFNPADFIRFPGGMSKFTVRRDSQTGIYWTLTNNNTNSAYPNQRNVLSLYASTDLCTWSHARTLMADDQGLAEEESIAQTGFQYVDWHFDEDDILYLVRTAYAGAVGYHDANRVTFARLQNFRRLTPRFSASTPAC